MGTLTSSLGWPGTKQLPPRPFPMPTWESMGDSSDEGGLLNDECSSDDEAHFNDTTTSCEPSKTNAEHPSLDVSAGQTNQSRSRKQQMAAQIKALKPKKAAEPRRSAAPQPKKSAALRLVVKSAAVYEEGEDLYSPEELTDPAPIPETLLFGLTDHANSQPAPWDAPQQPVAQQPAAPQQSAFTRAASFAAVAPMPPADFGNPVFTRASSFPAAPQQLAAHAQPAPWDVPQPQQSAPQQLAAHAQPAPWDVPQQSQSAPQQLTTHAQPAPWDVPQQPAAQQPTPWNEQSKTHDTKQAELDNFFGNCSLATTSHKPSQPDLSQARIRQLSSQPHCKPAMAPGLQGHTLQAEKNYGFHNSLKAHNVMNAFHAPVHAPIQQEGPTLGGMNMNQLRVMGCKGVEPQ